MSLISSNLQGEKQGNVSSEKNAVVVEVGEDLEGLPTDNPRKSSKERFSSFTRSIFTKKALSDTGGVLWKFARFSGPGAVISVAYVDPDNLQSNLTSGAEFRFKLLFMILFSNIVAVYLQVSVLKPNDHHLSLTFTNYFPGTVCKVGLRYRHGSGTDESCFSSSLAEHLSLAYG
jgi:hypothetical protein